jgi:hypothetical protein
MEKNLLTVKRKICLPQVGKICLPRKEKTVYLTGKILLDIQKLNGVKVRVNDASSRNTLSMVLEVLRNAQ